MRVICSDCCIHSVDDSRITIRSAFWIRNGAASIDSSIDARIACSSVVSTRCRSRIRFSSTKPNSPACARPRPVRIATPGAAPNRRARPVMMAAFRPTWPTKKPITRNGWVQITRGSSSIPVVTKNRPSSTSRNGLMSSSTWCRYGVSEISMPAMKAPSASDRPKRSVMNAAPSVTSSRLSTNSSCERRRATTLNQRVMNFWPTNSSSARAITIFTAARPRVTIRSLEDSPPNAAITISSGTTARSWNSSTPKMLRPCSVSISSRSASIFETIAVDDIASAPPSATLPCHVMCTQRSKTKPSSSATASVTTTCSSPSPNTSRCIARSLASENSRPIENIRNTTPNSARCSARSRSPATPSACGPTRMPTVR